MTTHLNKNHKPIMVDISKKKESNRTAKVQGIVQFSKKTFYKIESLKTKKGEIINTAIISGILGAKKTNELIPLCHNINIESIKIDIKPIKNKSSFLITCITKSFSKTGVEMEALSGVSIACLTIYDMCKSIDRNILIKEIRLIEKKGGKSNFDKS